ncbi:hypothetical protein [Catellatospora citrea]|uniref:Lipoprotein n=1 Tax=Catellatospora citrea TaxID=53366 RepID=A0A8J3P332_9ACTN|nr:hypothetical protein [Catellatospora citrea]RKE08960.1 hypothetical protein C8E86_3836 [Catellatospora citrea]GIG01892.1 hypothetical protein Cci01nite_69850 [Catellatospora citrea]
MPLRPTRPSNPALPLATACLVGVALLSGCGVPPELQPRPGTVPQPSGSPGAATLLPSPSLPPSFSLPPSAPPSSPGPFPELTVTDCQGRPSGEQVVAAVRRKSSILPGSGTITVTRPPVCAGNWQYTELTVPGREPLQVVTKGAPTALDLVTAGTDICTVEVRNFAPPGIRIAAGC